MAYNFGLQDMFPFMSQAAGQQQPQFKFEDLHDPSFLGAKAAGKAGNPAMGGMSSAAGMLGQSKLLGRPASGALGGAASGAGVGTMFAPGVGTAIGAGLGGTLGLLNGKSGGGHPVQPGPQLPSNYAQQWFGGGQ